MSRPKKVKEVLQETPITPKEKLGKIAFIWQGITQARANWKDGLYKAMTILEEEYDITYHEPTDDIPSDAIVFYWEAPVTIRGKDSYNYQRVMSLPNKKILLFAGGPIQKDWVKGFDLVCVESQINAREFDNIGKRNITAFGINDEVFFPVKEEKKYDGIHHGTCASWKRQDLLGRALKDKALVIGRRQDTDSMPFDVCKQMGCEVIEHVGYEGLNNYINQSHTMVQTSDFYGGGQRATLEAMACGIPVICMSDSPKNREYVEESGFGAVVDPQEEAIRNAVNDLKERKLDPKIGVDYIKGKFTARHYADKLKEAICVIQS